MLRDLNFASVGFCFALYGDRENSTVQHRCQGILMDLKGVLDGLTSQECGPSFIAPGYRVQINGSLHLKRSVIAHCISNPDERLVRSICWRFERTL